MRFSDLLYPAVKSIQSKWAALTVAFIAISAFCLCFAGTTLVTVQQEKSMPFELTVSTENVSGITDKAIAGILDTPDVENATPVIQLPAQVQMGGYHAELTLTGIKPEYIQDTVLPSSNVMPYIVMNEAACKMFSEGNNKKDMSDTSETNTPEKLPEIDWLNTKAILMLGEEGEPVTAKVCDILESEKEDEPIAYISLDAAKSLLKASGQSEVYQQANVRVKNIGCADAVSNNLTALGLVAENTNRELQARWDGWTTEMTYLFFIGAFALLCTYAALFAWRKINAYEQKEVHAALYYVGMTQSDVAKLLTLQAVTSSFIGAGIGILIAIVLPSFLPQELIGVSVFMLPISILMIVIVFMTCIGIIMPTWFIKNHSGILL